MCQSPFVNNLLYVNNIGQGSIRCNTVVKPELTVVNVIIIIIIIIYRVTEVGILMTAKVVVVVFAVVTAGVYEIFHQVALQGIQAQLVLQDLLELQVCQVHLEKA